MTSLVLNNWALDGQYLQESVARSKVKTWMFSSVCIYFNPFTLSRLFYHNSLDKSIPIAGCLVRYYCFVL